MIAETYIAPAGGGYCLRLFNADGKVWNGGNNAFETPTTGNFGASCLSMVQPAGSGFYYRQCPAVPYSGPVYVIVTTTTPGSAPLKSRVAWVKDGFEVVPGLDAMGIPSLADITTACGIMAIDDVDVASMGEEKFLYQLRASTVGGP